MWTSKRFKYLPLEEAHQLIIEITKGKAQQEAVPVLQAFNRVLAEDVISNLDLPPDSISHFDGYAVRAEDTSLASVDNPVYLKVVGKIYLDEEYKGKVNAKEAAYISTGCKLPSGANAVIPVELVKTKGVLIEVRRAIKPYENIIPQVVT